MKDTFHSFKTVAACAPAVITAAADGPVIDLAGFDSALVVVNTGAIAAAGDFAVKLQESDTTTGGDFTDVAAADMHGSFPASLAASSVYRVGYIGSKRKRYIRIAISKGGGTSIALGAVAVLGHAHIEPVA